MRTVPRKELSLFDSTCLIVGVVVGVGIYETAPTVASSTSHTWGVLMLWVAGGLLSLAGALCYAELATMYPHQGGDYVYLTRAYGPWAGFLFGWIQLVIVRPGDIALLAFVFARYAVVLLDAMLPGDVPPGPFPKLICASAPIILLTVINIFGVREGKWTQNVLTLLKVLGLLAILFVALAAPVRSPAGPAVEPLGSSATISLAMILVLFTFGGWNETVYVAAEVKNPQRNLVRALVTGTCTVTVLYLLVNGAFLYALGHHGVVASKAVATDTVKTMFPQFGSRIIAALICISALGTLNGLIFTSARISYAVGAEHRALSVLGRWHPRTGTPVWALLVQGGIAVALIVLLGSFTRAIIYTAAAVYSFYLATSLAVIVLRRKEPNAERPYKVTGYPFTNLVFSGSCALLIYGSLAYDPPAAAISAGILLAGLPIYWLTTRLGHYSRPR